MAENNNNINQAVAQGGSYDVIRKRLEQQSNDLEQSIVTLNAQRETEFGKTLLEVIDRVRVRTKNNCIPRDIVRINGQLLFGYNVFIGLKKATQISDVFALYSLNQADGKHEVHEDAINGSFLDDSQFKKQFFELYSYYKNTQLIQLRVNNQKLLAAFQIGEKITDIRVFRWSLNIDGSVNYIDDRGERDIELPPSHDFEWQQTGREHYIQGKHPHVSIVDEVFVETVGGNLTIKVEDNTEDGEGIYQEPVEEANQSLDDAEIFYAKLGSLILLKIKPYKEQQWRHFIFNTTNNDVKRIDKIGEACIQLPNEHGVIFPGGYYLQSGESKVFAEDVSGLKFKRKLNSPNGEDILFIFYEENEGKLALYSYNIIHKELQSPIFGHGYTLYDDGKMIIFRSDSDEASRIHPMQIWQTPYTSEEYSASQTTEESHLATIGNAELVQGISELYTITKMINEQQPSTNIYENLIKNIQRVLDGYYWLESEEIGQFSEQLKNINDTSELVLDEFEKVKSISQQSTKALKQADQELKNLLKTIHHSNWDTPAPFVDGLLQLKQQKGHLLSLKEYRYIDLQKIEKLSTEIEQELTTLGNKTVEFLSQEQAMQFYTDNVEQLHEKIGQLTTVKDLKPLSEKLETMGLGLDALSEVINGLSIDDTIQKTQILSAISTVYSRINQTKAHAKLTIKELASNESVAEFGAQLAVLSQSITNAISQADTPDACDEQLARLLIQLEELESLFSENDNFLEQIFNKRDELHETFESRKQTLLDQRQRQAQNIQSGAQRILKSIEKRTLKFTDNDQLNTYYSSDPMVVKVSELAARLRDLDDNVKADDIEAKLKAVKEQAIRSLRDKKDIFESGGNVIKLGQHRFSVNTQALDLSILPKDGQLTFHLSGTDYYQKIDNKDLHKHKAFWQQTLVSETSNIYRAEYLAYCVYKTIIDDPDQKNLEQALNDKNDLEKRVQDYASPRYNEGYEKGVHDHDASVILQQLLQIQSQNPLLRFNPAARAFAAYYWQTHQDQSYKDHQQKQADTAKKIKRAFSSTQMYDDLHTTLQQNICDYYQTLDIPLGDDISTNAAQYLVAHLQSGEKHYTASSNATLLSQQLLSYLKANGEQKDFNYTLKSLKDSVKDQWQYVGYWLTGLIEKDHENSMIRYLNEAIVMVLLSDQKCHQQDPQPSYCRVKDLLGDHQNINDRTVTFEFDELIHRLEHYISVTKPQYEHYKKEKAQVMTVQKASMGLHAFKARPLSSFVRNRLINESYLPIIGDNLAKQMGAFGQDKRSDLMGLLLLISPPGYGKTTLMEYTANRLGLNFMKINCPSLGHDVTSLDPSIAGNATAKQELEKLNLALEMSNNVMLYLDDIQHTNPEFLQKFISLCDGTRRIEGVWQGQSKTYDLRGKKFCVIMAGNPYTESGDVFTIPDMLANRADVYNLGDVLSGQQKIFSMSYIENALTSNSTLAPLALRDLNDLYLLMDMAQDKEVASADLSHSYSGSEINEITTVLKALFTVQKVILAVNQEYIRSAAMDDKYRQEPAFKLQGSYRNMNKMAEKVVAVMDENELQQMIDDHYVGEAQLLTTGAEENLLKLKQLRGTLTDQEQQRWQEITAEFKIRNSLAGDDSDGATKIASQISALKDQLTHFSSAINHDKQSSQNNAEQQVKAITSAIDKLSLDVNVVNTPLPNLGEALTSLSETMTTSFIPIVVTLNKKLDINTEVLEKVTNLSEKLQQLTQKKSVKTVTKKSSAKTTRTNKKTT